MVRRRPKAKQAILSFLSGRDPQILKDIAEGVGLVPSAVHRHLQELVEDGLLHRKDAHSPEYSLAPFLQVRWNDFLGNTHHTWQVQDVVDWRYPLATRIADDAVRTSLLSFLHECEKQGLWTPWVMYESMPWEDHVPDHVRRKSTDPAHYREGVTCVWRDDHLLVLTPADTPENRPRFPYASSMAPIAEAAGVRLVVQGWAEWDKVAGTTVFTTADPPRFVESV